MNLYKQFLKPLLFQFNPEFAHHFTTKLLKFTLLIPGMKWVFRAIFSINNPKLSTHVFGIEFPNPVGLAAGFDKDGKYYSSLDYLGFGFIEIGTVTPKAQSGNAKPRLFRLPQDESLINRMGFNNEGVDAMVARLKNRNRKFIVGGNIGKNKVTPNQDALSDYLFSFEKLYEYVDYFVVNVSSPNTPGLRELQDKEPLTKILKSLQNKRREFIDSGIKTKPILLKIAPDITNEQLDDIIEIIKSIELDGIVATNTTITRENLKTLKNIVDNIGAGGVSGKIVSNRSTDVIRYLYKGLGDKYPIIGVGGIHTPKDAIEKLKAGAKLIQVYTGFIYEGPSIVKRINKAILNERTN